MQVELRAFATLRKYLPDHPLDRGVTVPVEPGTTVAQLLAKVGILRDEVKIIMVNNRHADFDRKLHDGDRVAVFPPVAGG